MNENNQEIQDKQGMIELGEKKKVEKKKFGIVNKMKWLSKVYKYRHVLIFLLFLLLAYGVLYKISPAIAEKAKDEVSEGRWSRHRTTWFFTDKGCKNYINNKYPSAERPVGSMEADFPNMGEGFALIALIGLVAVFIYDQFKSED